MASQNMDWAVFIEFRSVSLLTYKGSMKESDTCLYGISELSESSFPSLVSFFSAGQMFTEWV